MIGKIGWIQLCLYVAVFRKNIEVIKYQGLIFLCYIISGCSSFTNYLYYRSLDLSDCISIYVSDGPSVPINIGVEITHFLPVGIGATGLADPGALGYGLSGRMYGEIPFYTRDLPFQFFFGNGFGFPNYIGGTYYNQWMVQGWNKRRYGRIGAHFGLLVGYVSIDIEVIEILDLLTSIFGFDLSSDDNSEVFFKPTKPL